MVAHVRQQPYHLHSRLCFEAASYTFLTTAIMDYAAHVLMQYETPARTSQLLVCMSIGIMQGQMQTQPICKVSSI